MTKKIKTKKVGSTETKNSAEKSVDKYLGTIPFQLLEVRMYETNSTKRPAYKVRMWNNENSTPIWLCGSDWLHEKPQNDLEALCYETTFIYGGAIILLDLCKNGWDSAVANGNQELSWYEHRCTLSTKQELENAYVGVDIFETKEGLKFCVGGSNFIVRQQENGYTILIDEIALKLMSEKEKAA